MSAKQGFLILHGLTATPATMAPIEQHLRKQGFLTHTPLLAGHGLDWKTLSQTGWEDWYQSVKKSLCQLQSKCDVIHLCGHSMGSLLCLKLASEMKSSITSLTLLALPLKLTPLPSILIPLFRYTPLHWVKPFVYKRFDKSVADPKGRLLYQKSSLDKIPAQAVFQFQDLAKHVRGQLSKITQPILAIQALKDHIAHPKSIALLKKSVASRDLSTLFLKTSQHIIPLDSENRIVVQKIIHWIAQLNAKI